MPFHCPRPRAPYRTLLAAAALLASACGGRVEGSSGGALPGVTEGASPSETSAEESGGEDPLAAVAAACAARPTFEPSAPLSRSELGASLEGIWVLCPESLALPDPLFGTAAHVGIELLSFAGARALFSEGASIVPGPTSLAWALRDDATLEVLGFSSGPRTYDVVLAADRGALHVMRRDLGDSVYTLVRVTR